MVELSLDIMNVRRRLAWLINVKQEGKIWVVYRNGWMFCHSKDEELIREVANDLKVKEAFFNNK